MDSLEKPRRLKLVPDPALHGAGGVTFEPLKLKNAGETEECPVSPASQGQQLIILNVFVIQHTRFKRTWGYRSHY
jgi:hypothetical protein